MYYEETETETEVTSEFRVDQFESVYDEEGMFYCKWEALDNNERRLVKSNPYSAK